MLHLDAVHTGLSFIPLTAVMTASSLLSARVGRRRSALSIMTFGLAVQCAGFILLSQIVPGGSLWLLNGALVLVGIGSASTVPAMNNMMLAVVSREDAGMASGLMSSARQVGGIVGVAVFGMLISATDAETFTAGMSTSMKICAAAVLSCIAMTRFLIPSRSSETETRRIYE
jgi:DHA2 family methylenomycin A resistance protein-like MFS transporter